MTLTEFLLARIAEDEYRAKSLAHAPSMPQGMSVRKHFRLNVAECEAKRRIVTLWQTAALTEAHEDEAPSDYPESYVRAVEQTVTMEAVLHALALPYADHPDYLPEWKP